MKKVPKRRFKGFLNAGDWEQRKLGELLEQPITDGPHETPELYDSGIPFISVDAIIDNKIDFTKMRGCISKEYDDICAKKYKPQINDVYLVKSGATIGKVAIVDTYDDFNIWSPLAAMRCGSITNPYFLYVLLQTKDLQTQVFNKASHGTQPNLSMRQLETFACKVPKIEEQILISRFFKRLNDSITLHQRKLEKLQATKKALLYELFPIENSRRPKLRFKGFTGDWEQRKLGDVVKRESVTQVSSTEYPAIEYEDVIPETGQLNKDIYKKGVQKAGILFDANKVLYGKLRPYLHNWVAPMYKGVAVGDWWVLNPCGLDRGFLYTLIQTVKFDTIANQSTGSKMPRADWKLLSTTEFSIPSLDEQIKIGKLVEGLNDYITLHQRKLEKLKNLKAAYLNEMFV